MLDFGIVLLEFVLFQTSSPDTGGSVPFCTALGNSGQIVPNVVPLGKFPGQRIFSNLMLLETLEASSYERRW